MIYICRNRAETEILPLIIDLKFRKSFDYILPQDSLE